MESVFSFLIEATPGIFGSYMAGILLYWFLHKPISEKLSRIRRDAGINTLRLLKKELKLNEEILRFKISNNHELSDSRWFKTETYDSIYTSGLITKIDNLDLIDQISLAYAYIRSFKTTEEKARIISFAEFDEKGARHLIDVTLNNAGMKVAIERTISDAIKAIDDATRQ